MNMRRTPKRFVYVLALLCLFLPQLAQADRLKLKDDSVLSGAIYHIDFVSESLFFRLNNGTELQFRFSEIDSYGEQNLDVNDLPVAPGRVPSSDPPKYQVAGMISTVRYRVEEDVHGGVANTSDAEANGGAFSVSRYINNKFAVEIGIYRGATNKVDESGIEVPLAYYTDYENVSLYGARFDVVYGWNVRDKGWRVYTGLGAFHEHARLEHKESGVVRDKLYGYGVKLGGGYKWLPMGLDWWVNYRTDDAVGFMDRTTQSGIQLSYSF